MPTTAEGSIVVQAPISAVYALWTQFEEFPRFMGGVTSVRFLTDTRLEWVAEPEGAVSSGRQRSSSWCRSRKCPGPVWMGR